MFASSSLQYSTCICFHPSNPFSFSAVCLRCTAGSLRSQVSQPPCGLCSRIPLYSAPPIFLVILHSFFVSVEEKHRHSIRLPLKCFPVALCSGWQALPVSSHTCLKHGPQSRSRLTWRDLLSSTLFSGFLYMVCGKLQNMTFYVFLLNNASLFHTNKIFGDPQPIVTVDRFSHLDFGFIAPLGLLWGSWLHIINSWLLKSSWFYLGTTA